MSDAPRVEILLRRDLIAYEARIYSNYQPLIPIEAFFQRPANKLLKIEIPDDLRVSDIFYRRTVVGKYARHPHLIHLQAAPDGPTKKLTISELAPGARRPGRPEADGTGVRSMVRNRLARILETTREAMTDMPIGIIDEVSGQKAALVRVDSDGYILEILMAHPEFDFVIDPGMAVGINLSAIMDLDEHSRSIAMIRAAIDTGEPQQITVKIRAGKKARLRRILACRRDDNEVIVVECDVSRPV